IILVDQDAPEVEMRQSVFGLVLNGLPVLLERLFEAALILEQEAQIVVGFRIEGVDLDRLPERLVGLAVFSLLKQQHAVAVMGVRAVRVEGDRGAVMLLRLLVLAEPSVKRVKTDVRLT